MVRLLLRAYIKRFLSIFLSLIFIGSVSAGLFNAFLSAKDHLYNDPIRFFDAYGYVDEYISVPLDERSEFNRLYELDGVASIDMRLSIDAHLKKDDGRVINSRIFTYNDEEGEIISTRAVHHFDYIVNELLPNLDAFRKEDDLMRNFVKEFKKQTTDDDEDREDHIC